MNKLTVLIGLAVASLATACGPLPTPNSDPAAATEALTQMGYTNIANVTPLNTFTEACSRNESLYCNHFVADDRRGVRVSGTVVEENDGELEVDHQD